MSLPINYSFPRYLAAKKSIDDRALNRRVWETLIRRLPPATPARPLYVLEVGAGIGTMLERMLERNLLAFADYTAIDEQAENLACFQERLPEWALENGFILEDCAQNSWSLSRSGQQVAVKFEVANLFAFAQRVREQRRWDLLVAHAFLDLMNVPLTLPRLFNLLRPGGLFYFSLNFDGLTLLEPAVDPDMDELIQTLYHRNMDERLIAGRPSGDSRTGRHLFTYLQEAGAQILDAGASDWVVYAGPEGYPAEEAYFLHYIIETICQALAGHPQLEAAQFAEWVAARHAQIERQELVYIAHQLDFVGIYGGN